MPRPFVGTLGLLGTFLLLSMIALAQPTPEEPKSPVSNEAKGTFSTMVTTTRRASVGLINAEPAIGASAQILYALISELPVNQPRSNVYNGSKVTIRNDSCVGFIGVVRGKKRCPPCYSQRLTFFL
jgi:hypothetical protein